MKPESLNTVTFIDAYDENDCDVIKADSPAKKQLTSSNCATESTDDIIIETSPNSNKPKPPQLNGKPHLKPMPFPNRPFNSSQHQPPHRSPITPTTHNTYCDMCNARFSNVESFSAHMRNCHPNIPYQPPQLIVPAQFSANSDSSKPTSNGIKMPYLTSILGANNPEPLKTKAPLTPVMNKNAPKSTCTIPNCNCSPTLEQQSDSESLYSGKETHYTCGQCNLTLVKLQDYMLHLKQEHCVEVFRCMLCKQMQLFDNLTLLKEHFFQVHSSTKTEYHRCRICPPGPSSLFTSVEDLNNHFQQVDYNFL